jgi:hypothetical protein
MILILIESLFPFFFELGENIVWIEIEVVTLL